MDDAVATLKQLSQQLNSFSINHPFVNSTQRVDPVQDDTTQVPFLPLRSIVAINTLWFSSLVFSLTSASLALIVKQSLYELTYRIPRTSREGAQLRQHRLDNLVEWRISTIITVIPLLLQIALILFLTGLILLLRSLQDTVAAVTTAWVAFLFVFLAAFTFIPAVKWHCSYRSPQAHFVYAIVRFFHDGSIQLARKGVTFFTRLIPAKGQRGGLFWLALQRWCKQVSSWPIYGAWEVRERAYLSSPKTSLALDVAIGTTACNETLDPTCLDNLRIALSAECDNLSLAKCLRSLGWMSDIHKSNRATLLMRSADPQTLPTFLHSALRQMFAIPRDKRHVPTWEKDVDMLRNSLNRLNNPHDDQLNDKFLNLNFMIAMEATSRESVYTALTYLAGAVNVTSPQAESPGYLVVSRGESTGRPMATCLLK